jgi:peroxiredoxin/mono/diheme cytochrome c family protein
MLFVRDRREVSCGDNVVMWGSKMKTMLNFLRALPLALCASSIAWAMNPGERVDNFRLLDETGKSHELYYLSDMKAVVLMTQGNGCPIVRHAIHALHDVRAQFKDKGVAFLLINSNLQDTRDTVAAESKEFAFDVPILLDSKQLVGESLHFTRTAEVFIINPKDWKLMYRGPIDDRLSYEKQRPAANHHYLKDALDSVLAGQPVKDAKVDAPGCIINFPERDRRSAHADISYSKTIAPMLTEKCVACHQTGGIGPFAMTSYDVVKGFAPMIREVVRTQRMPPWHADPHYGSFVGDRSLSDEQAKTLVHWIEAGALRGSGTDPLAKVKPEKTVWQLGKPDVIIDIPAFDVPATGVIEYKCPTVKNPIGRDVWIAGLEVHVGDKSVVHHIIVNNPSDTRAAQERARGGQGGEGRVFCSAGGNLGGFAPGLQPIQFPKDTGVLFPKDSDFVFQIHYTPNGKAATDRSRVGLYFHKKPPKHPLHMTVVGDLRFVIPPGAKEHTVTSKRQISRDMLVYDIMPHAHVRGKAAKLTVSYPDGRSEVLLNVPRYDFKWQTGYVLKEPITLPKGSTLVWDMTWDNSTQNPANPDPTKPVRWGDQTWEEMGLGFLRYRWLDESEKPKSASTGIESERVAKQSAL